MKTHTSQNKHRNSQKEKITHSLLSDCMLLWGQLYTNNQLIILNNEVFLISLGLTQQNTMSSFPHWVSAFLKSLLFSSQLLECKTKSGLPLGRYGWYGKYQRKLVLAIPPGWWITLPRKSLPLRLANAWATSFSHQEDLATHAYILTGQTCLLHWGKGPKHFRKGPAERMGARFLTDSMSSLK